MASTKKKFDEFYEKPSKHRSWSERGEAPVITRNMNAQQIAEFRQVLADSYQAPPEEIIVNFERILDENDEDRVDCIWVRYSMKCIIAGAVVNKSIYNVKIPVPEHLRAAAAKTAGSTSTKRAPARARALPAPAPAPAPPRPQQRPGPQIQPPVYPQRRRPQ